MPWFLQTPGVAGPKLLASIIGEFGSASKGGAAFAFASSAGIKLLAAEESFQKFIASSVLSVVIGLDAITDTKALDALRVVRDKYPNFKPRVFLHGTVGALFHPKTIWLRSAKGGVIITGSGNLTMGGLKSNWEALSVERLLPNEIDEVEKYWDDWVASHPKYLLPLDDEKAIERAKANGVQKARIIKALKLPPLADINESTEAVVEEILPELKVNPILLAEVPKSGNRWKQINFDIKTYQEFFGVTLGKSKNVEFRHVNDDGSLGALEKRHAVAVKSQNYRFEIAAAQGLDYPAKGHPIVIFEKITETSFHYLLLMPNTSDHKLIQKFLDKNFVKTRGKRRVTTTLGALDVVWPANPLSI